MKHRNYNHHGIISIIFVLIAFSIGIISVAINSLLWGFVDFLLVPIAFVVVAIVYCSKCKCRETCNHVIIGKLSILLSKRNSNPYTAFDWTIGLAPMVIALIFPQYWLIRNPLLLICFWSFLLFGGFEALFCVCNRCNNYKCKLCRNKRIGLNNEK
jgi:hypothetical protein